MLDPQLKGKVALITGANNPIGIGAAIAKALAAQGASVYVTYYRLVTPPEAAAPEIDEDATQDFLDDHDLEHPTEETPIVPGEAYYLTQQTYTAQHLLRDIREAGGRANACEADLSDPSLIPLLFDRVEAAFDAGVDILINNAAFCIQDTLIPANALSPDMVAPDGFALTGITPETHDWHFAVNSRAVALLMSEYARRYVARGASWGRIINISTDASGGFAGEVSYGASKHALESYSRAAAREFGRYGITVNIASLGPIQTGWIAPELEPDIVKHTPLGRVGTPQDVADAVMLLASEQARWITGQLLYVGGGHKMGD